MPNFRCVPDTFMNRINTILPAAPTCTALDWWAALLPPASSSQLEVYLMVIVGYFHNTNVEIIVQWLKFKDFLVKLIIPLRSGLTYVTSTFFHPLLTLDCPCLSCKMNKSGDGCCLSGARPWLWPQQRLLSAIATQIRIRCLAAAWN